jgi:hypothetical protein
VREHRLPPLSPLGTLAARSALAIPSVSGSDGRFERPRRPGRAEDCGEASGPMHAVPHRSLRSGARNCQARHGLQTAIKRLASLPNSFAACSTAPPASEAVLKGLSKLVRSLSVSLVFKYTNARTRENAGQQCSVNNAQIDNARLT